MVRRIRCPGYVEPFRVEAARSLISLRISTKSKREGSVRGSIVNARKIQDQKTIAREGRKKEGADHQRNGDCCHATLMGLKFRGKFALTPGKSETDSALIRWEESTAPFGLGKHGGRILRMRQSGRLVIAGADSG